MTATVGPGNTIRSSEADLEDLRKPALTTLCVASIVVAWVWIAVVATLEERSHAVLPLLPPLALLSVSLLTIVKNRLDFFWRSILFLVGMTTAIMPWFSWPVGDYRLFYQPLVVVVAGLLIGPAASLVAAAMLTGVTALVLGLGQHGPLPAGLLPSLALLWATAIVSWLSSRNLYIVLSWALTSQARAWESANEARRRRGELRRMVDSLRTTHEMLERTTAELELARREAEQARRLRSEFAANISHELRTPLNIVLGFTEIMSRSPEVYGISAWPPILRRDLLEIRRNASHLSSLVDDIIDLARLDALHMPVRRDWTDLNQVIHEAVQVLHRLLEKKTVKLQVVLPQDLPKLLIDSTRIRQVLINLLSNAYRFTEEGSITVSATLQAEEVLVRIADTGAGIPPERLESIFDEFEQAEAWQEADKAGKGLGLAIAKHLVQLHGGRIWAASNLNEGTTVSFTLPLTRAEVPFLLRTGRPERALSWGKHLVVLSDSEYSALFLRRRMEGYEIHRAETAQQASDLVDAWHPDGVIVDLSAKPKCEVGIRPAFTPHAGIPIIECYLPRHRMQYRDGREARVLVKPISSEALVREVLQVVTGGEILVVDDDRGFVQFVQRSFQAAKLDHKVSWAYDGLEALAKVRAQQPDMVLLDVVLPELGGLAVAQAMQDDPELAKVPVMFVSGGRSTAAQFPACPDAFRLTKVTGFASDEVVSLIKNVLATVKPDYVHENGQLQAKPGTGHG